SSLPGVPPIIVSSTPKNKPLAAGRQQRPPQTALTLTQQFSAALDGHLPRLGDFLLGQVHGQHAVFALRLDALCGNRLIYLEDAVEITFLVLSRQQWPAMLTRIDPAMQDQLAAF